MKFIIWPFFTIILFCKLYAQNYSPTLGVILNIGGEGDGIPEEDDADEEPQKGSVSVLEIAKMNRAIIKYFEHDMQVYEDTIKKYAALEVNDPRSFVEEDTGKIEATQLANQADNTNAENIDPDYYELLQNVKELKAEQTSDNNTVTEYNNGNSNNPGLSEEARKNLDERVQRAEATAANYKVLKIKDTDIVPAPPEWPDLLKDHMETVEKDFDTGPDQYNVTREFQHVLDEAEKRAEATLLRKSFVPERIAGYNGMDQINIVLNLFKDPIRNIFPKLLAIIMFLLSMLQTLGKEKFELKDVLMNLTRIIIVFAITQFSVNNLVELYGTNQ